MIQLTRNVSLPHRRIKLSKGFFKDLRMWEDFISNWNGAVFFYAFSLGHFSFLVSVHRCLWFSGIWEHFSNPLVSGLMGTPSKTRSARISIAWQELFAFVVACHLWANFFSNKHIQFFCDNESVVSIVNTKRSRIPRVMDLVRHLTLLTPRFNFCIRAEHIEGKRNDMADSLSRFQMDRFRELVPHANRDQCLVPPELLKNSLLNRSSIPLSRDTWQQSVIFTSATATSLTLRSSIACTLSAVALRDLKVAQSELVCQLQYPTSNFSTPF